MRILQSILWILFGLVIGYVLLLGLVYLVQGQMVYHPERSITYTPDDIGLSYEEVYFSTGDGLTLHGWYVPSEVDRATVLYFHGNAGNISGRLQTIQLLYDLGLNVFIFDYRGYGQSEGHPTEQGTYKDALAAWDYITSKKVDGEDDIIIMGRSLGGAVASWLAARTNPTAAIIESTFTSAADLGADLYPWLPVGGLLRYKYATKKNISQITVPLFMAHSVEDEIVPYHHGKRLFKAANEPKEFLELKGSHGSGFWETGDKYREALQAFLTKHLSSQ